MTCGTQCVPVDLTLQKPTVHVILHGNSKAGDETEGGSVHEHRIICIACGDEETGGAGGGAVFFRYGG